MYRSFLKKIFVSLLILSFCAAVYITFSWGTVLYRTFHISTNLSDDSPGWISDGKHDSEHTKISLPNSKNRKTHADIHIYRPKDIKETSFVVFVPGFTDKGASDKRIVRLSKAFAESGIGVAVTDTGTMRDRIFNKEDVIAITETFRYLEQQDYVIKDKIAICGFSVAGSYALIAASDPGIDPLFVMTFGGYYDLKDLVAAVASGKAVHNGISRTWIPGDIPVEVVRKNVGYEIINAEPEYEEARSRLEKLSEKKLRIFEELSPSHQVKQINSPVYILHSSKDDSIPVEESYRLNELLSGNNETSFTELRGLSHVTPKDFVSIDYIKLTFQLLSMMKALEY